MARMIVTVAICTWNRADLLDRTLTEMHSLRNPPGVEWELLVVNNHCTDDTDEVIARHSDRLPIRRLFEERQGHSHARNCAVAAAAGELIIWTDDDVLVDPDWMGRYVESAGRWPEISFFGGPVYPWFEVDPPGWISRNVHDLWGPFALLDLGSDVRPLSDKEGPIGANMAFRRDTLKEVGFSSRFGRVGGELRGSDEVDVITRVRKQGGRGLWVGNAGVRHFVPKARFTLEYLGRWYRCSGKDAVRLGWVEPCPTVLGVPRWVVRVCVAASAASWFLSPFKSDSWLQSFRNAAFFRGVIEETMAVRARIGSAGLTPLCREAEF
jgi:glycosyltransferase involved in cell wall biosynthesis